MYSPHIDELESQLTHGVHIRLRSCLREDEFRVLLYDLSICTYMYTNIYILVITTGIWDP